MPMGELRSIDLAGECLVHNGGQRCACAVFCIEEAALLQGDAHGAEVIRRGRARVCALLMAGSGLGRPANSIVFRNVQFVRSGRTVVTPAAVDAGELPDAREHRLDESGNDVLAVGRPRG